MTETARTPQTFDEWRDEYRRSQRLADGSYLLVEGWEDDFKGGWDAALASQQAELRAAREVVEAASDVDDLAPTLRAFIDDPLFHQACSALHDCLSAYRLTTSEDKG